MVRAVRYRGTLLRGLALAFCAWVGVCAHAADSPTAPGARIELLDIDAPLDKVPPADGSTAARPMPLTLPYRDAGSWVRITVEQSPAEPRLLVESMVAAPVVLLLPDGSRIERSKLRPDDDAAASSVALVFPLPANLTAQTPLLLHFEHQHRALTHITLLSRDAWLQQERGTLIVATMLYTSLAAFAMVTLCFWLVVRERIYVQYAAFLVFWLIYMASNSGLLYRVPGASMLAALGIHGQWAILSISIALPFGFARDYLDIARNAPRLRPWFDGVMYTLLVAAVVVGASPWPLAWYGMAMAAVASTLFSVLIAVGFYVALTSRDRYAYFFLAGWIPMSMGGLLRALQASGLVDVAVMHMYALGVLLQAAVLMLGLADRLLRARRERDHAQSVADHDVLTGLLNRRALEQRLRARVDDAKHGGPGLAMLFLDIDHFKSINDSYGHAGGDLCLQILAQRIGAELRAGDLLGRWGGEEFVSLLPAANIEDARRISERIRHAIAEIPVDIKDRSAAVTISIGIAVFDPARDSTATLIARADAALYRAKNGGRNRVEVMSEAVAA